MPGRLSLWRPEVEQCAPLMLAESSCAQHTTAVHRVRAEVFSRRAHAAEQVDHLALAQTHRHHCELARRAPTPTWHSRVEMAAVRVDRTAPCLSRCVDPPKT
jgi:hypothetical protein